MDLWVHIYIYIYIEREREREIGVVLEVNTPLLKEGLESDGRLVRRVEEGVH